MNVNITQFNVQLYFRRPVLADSDVLRSQMFSSAQGFEAKPTSGSTAMVNDVDNATATATASSSSSSNAGRDINPSFHPMQGILSFYREGFRIAPVQSNVLPFRILQVMSYPNALKEPDSETLVCIRFVAAQLQKHLNIDIDNDIYATRVVSHCIVEGDKPRMLDKVSSIEHIPSLVNRYVAHKNPMGALQIVTRSENDLSQMSWSDIRISQFKDTSYVVTIFNETRSLALAIESISHVKQFVGTMLQEMEQTV